MKPTLIHLLWAALATGAFYAGTQMRSSRAEAAARATETVATVTPVAPESAAAPSGRQRVAISRDDAVQDFFRRYKLDGSSSLSYETMREAAAEALRESDPIKSQMLFARLMEELNPENAPAVLEMVRQNVSGFESMRYLSLLAYAWGSVEPEKAMQEMTANQDRFGGRLSQSLVVAGWASTDPAGAIAWLEKERETTQQEGGRGRREDEWMTQSLITGLARSDIKAAMQYAGGISEEGMRVRSAETIAREVIRQQGLEAATQWFSQISDPQMQRGAFEALAEQQLRLDPAAAAALVKQHADKEYVTGAVGNVAESLARRDVQQALTFANSLNGQAQARAMGQVIDEWMEKENGSLEASSYVSKLPPGPSRDAGASAIAREIVREDPQAAIAWAGSIQNPEMRMDATFDIARMYRRVAPEEAAAWLANSGLPPEMQQQVLSGGGDEDRWGGRRRGPPMGR